MSQPLYQDLTAFRQPADFRGRSAVTVQLWWLVQALLFRTSPQFMYGWRRWLLRRFGARIGRGVLIRPTVRTTYPWRLSVGDHAWIGDQVELYTIADIAIGRHAVISQQAYLCTGSHDMAAPAFDTWAAPIVVEDEAWVAAAVFVHPGVRIGRGAVIGARAVMMADAEPGMVYAGAPARAIRPRLPDDRR